MTQEQQQLIANALEKTLEKSEQIWIDQSQSHAWIVGYLQGSIKAVIDAMK